METTKDRLLKFLEEKKIGQNAFEKIAGIANGYISHNKGSIGSGIANKISVAYPELNIAWLTTGEGEMLKTNLAQENAEHIPLLPISAQAGTLNDFLTSIKNGDCERIISPIKGADFALMIAGDSMAPEYPSGAQILVKKINEKAFIDWGKVYVLDTCNGSVIKKILPADNEDVSKVKCMSINPEYPPFEVSFSDINGVYRVLLCMSIK